MIVATLGLITSGDALLLGLKKKKGADFGAGLLMGPGGKIESGEGIQENLLRETSQEWEIRLVPEKLEQVALLRSYRAGIPWFVVHVFRASEFSGEPRESWEMTRPEPYPIKNLPFKRMPSTDPRWIRQALRGERLSVRIDYRDAEGRDLKFVRVSPLKE